jgi:hypothetical protein
MATFEEIKAQVTAEVESEKPLYGQNTETGRYEYTDSDYEQVIIDRTNTKFDLQENGWIEDRLQAYGSFNSQLDMQYWDQVNRTTVWKDHVAKVKSDYPKPE